MAQTVLTNAKIYFSGWDLSGDFNQLALAVGAAAINDTAFGDSTESFTGGLKTGAVEARGFWNGGANTDKPMFDRVGTADVPLMFAADGADAGEVAYFLKALTASYQVGGSIGELLPFSVSAMASGGTPLVRGTTLFNGTATTTADEADIELGAVSSTQKLYAALFVLGAPAGSSPTLDVKIQSDADTDFASATDRVTFTQATARGAEFAAPVSGAITDTFWRASYTIGGTGSPSFRFAVVMGIL